MEQVTHTAGLLKHLEQGEANSHALMTDDGRWLISLLHNGEQTAPRQAANMRRLAAAWNACNGLETEELEALGAGALPSIMGASRTLRAASQLVIDAYGGDVPDWLRAEFVLLRNARKEMWDVLKGCAKPTNVDAMRHALRVAVRVFDCLAEGQDYNTICEQTGCMAIVSQALIGEPNDDPRAELAAIRAAVQAIDEKIDDAANNNASARPPTGDDYNDVCAIVMRGAPDPWHLFYIEASDADGTHAYLVSAQSGSQSKAQELAEATVRDELCGSEEEPCEVEHVGFIGIVDGDVCETVGLLADA